MEGSIRHLAGRSFKVFLRKQTSHPVKAVFAGLMVTAVLQSSSIVNLLTLAFVAAGVVTMRNALAVILGANVGSTVYNWIVVYAGFKFDIQSFAFPLMAIGAIGLIFFQHQKRAMHWTRLIIGFSLLFFGLSNIKSGVELLVSGVDFVPYTHYGIWLFALAGFVITTIVQSSSTTVVIALAALNAGAIDLVSAGALVIGSELGTSIKVVLGSIGNIPDKKRVAMGNFLFNLSGSIVAFILLRPILVLITQTAGITDPLISLVCFQSAINVLTVILFFPFLKPFAAFLEGRFTSGSADVTTHLKKVLLNEPEEGFRAARRETQRLLLNAVHLNMEALEMERYPENRLIRPEDLIGRPKLQSYSDHYETIKHLNGAIIDYCLELKQADPDGSESVHIDALMTILRSTMNATKSVKDIRHNIKEYRDSENDLLHSFYKRIRDQEAPFYASILEALYMSEAEFSDAVLVRLLQENKMRYDLHLAEVFQLSGKEKLHDLEMATLINVFTAIHTSHEFMTQAVLDLHAMQNGQETNTSASKG